MRSARSGVIALTAMVSDADNERLKAIAAKEHKDRKAVQ
jgi:hypothetical protein